MSKLPYTKAIKNDQIYIQQLGKLYTYVKGNANNSDKYSLSIVGHYLQDLDQRFANHNDHKMTVYIVPGAFAAIMNFPSANQRKIVAANDITNRPYDSNGNNLMELVVDAPNLRMLVHHFTVSFSIHHSPDDYDYLVDKQGQPDPVEASDSDMVNDLTQYIMILQTVLQFKINDYRKKSLHTQTKTDEINIHRKRIHNGPYSWFKVFGRDDRVHDYHDEKPLLDHY